MANHKTLISGVEYNVLRGNALVDGVTYELQKGLTANDEGFQYILFTPSSYTVYVGGTMMTSIADYFYTTFIANGQYIKTTSTGRIVAYPNVEPGSTYSIVMNCNGTFGVDASISIATYDNTTSKYVTNYVTNPDPRVTVDYNNLIVTFTDTFINNTYISFNRATGISGTIWQPTIWIPYPAP